VGGPAWQQELDDILTEFGTEGPAAAAALSAAEAVERSEELEALLEARRGRAAADMAEERVFFKAEDEESKNDPYDLRFYAMSTEFLLSLERLPSHEEMTGFLRKRPASLANLAAKHLGMTAGPANDPAASYRESGGPAHMPGKQKQAPGGGGGKLRSEISVSGGGSISGASVGSFGSVGGHGAGGGQGGPKLSAFEAALQAAATAVAAPANKPAAGAAKNGPGGSTGGVAGGPGKGEGEKSGEGGPRGLEAAKLAG